MCVRGLYSAEWLEVTSSCQSPTSTELEQKSHSHIWQREKERATAWHLESGRMIYYSELWNVKKKKKKKKLIMRTDFTFQVAASECHKAGGDEVVHVLASAAHVFLPIVTWWEEEKQEINISATLRWRDVADLSRFQVSSWVSRVPTNIYKALKCPSVIKMTIFYLCPHSICNQTRWFLLKGRRNIL